MSRKQQNRLNEISKLLNQRHNVHVEELSRIFGISENTVRRDLAQLEKENDDIVRFHGGALKKEIHVPHLFDYSRRVVLNTDEKKRIARAAYEMAKEHSGFILDSGTTCAVLADTISRESGTWKPTVLTPSSMVFEILKNHDQTDVVLSGGFWDQETQGFYGLPAERFFDDTHVSAVFLAVMGISTKGISINTFQEVPLKQAMLRASDTKIVLADSSKISLNTMGQIALLNEVDLLITGKEAQNHPDIEMISSQLKIQFV